MDKILNFGNLFVNMRHVRTIEITDNGSEKIKVRLGTDVCVNCAYYDKKYRIDEIKAAIAAGLDHESNVFSVDRQLALWHQPILINDMEDGGY